MKTTMLLASYVVIGSMIWDGTVAGASPQEAGSSASQAGEVMTLKIEGWTCASCEKDIRRALLAVPGVHRADVSYSRGGAIVTVEHGRINPDQLLKAVESASTLLSTYRAFVIPNESLREAGRSEDGGGSIFKRLFH